MDRYFRRNETLVAVTIVGLCLLIGLSNPIFFTVGNLFDLLRSMVVIGIFAMGVLIVIISGGIDVTWWGKTSTFGLMFAFPLFLVAYADVSWSTLAEVLAYGIGVPSLILHYYAAWGYIPIARAALAEGRSGGEGQVV